MEFGEKIQKLRNQNKWTQEQLAEKLYVLRTAESKWESNKGYPNIDSLKDIAKLFNISIDELLSSEEIIEKDMYILSTIIIFITVIGRLISGVHWFTDIIAGILISIALLMTFYLSIYIIKK